MQERQQQQAAYLDYGRDNSSGTQSIDVIDLTGESVVVAEQQHSALGRASAGLKSYRDMSRRNLNEREAALTCPISFDLFENPVVTECCGKTFSSEALAEVLKWNPRCPICSAPRVRTHAIRDIANLVELHRSERSLLDVAEATVQQTIGLEGHTSIPQRNYQERQNQRTQAQSAVLRLDASMSGGAAAPIVLED